MNAKNEHLFWYMYFSHMNISMYHLKFHPKRAIHNKKERQLSKDSKYWTETDLNLIKKTQ